MARANLRRRHGPDEDGGRAVRDGVADVLRARNPARHRAPRHVLERRHAAHQVADAALEQAGAEHAAAGRVLAAVDRKSTRLNSSHFP